MNFAPLETNRLQLRRFEQADLRALAYLLGDNGIPRITLPDLPLNNTRDLLAWIEACHTDMVTGVRYTFGCWKRMDHTLLGVVSLSVGDSKGEVGFWFIEQSYGHGYEVEALLRIKELALDGLYLPHLYAAADPANRNVANTVKKLGAKLVQRNLLKCPTLTEGGQVQLFELNTGGYSKSRGPQVFPIVFVAAVALVDGFDRVLLGQRPANATMPDLWEFPGGKLEPRETPRDCAVREIKEELGVEISPDYLVPFSIASHHYSNFHLLISLFTCREWFGDCYSLYHQAIRWVPAAELTVWPVPPADVQLVLKLQALLTVHN